MIRYTSGVVCVLMSGPDLDRLSLPPMTHVNEDRKQTAYSVSVDARDGATTVFRRPTAPIQFASLLTQQRKRQTSLGQDTSSASRCSRGVLRRWAH